MKKLKVNIDYKLPQEQMGKLTNYNLTENYFIAGVTGAYKELEGQLRRVFGRILDKIDKASEANEDYIELEKSEQDMFKKIFDDKVSFNPSFARYVTKLEDEVEIMLKSGDTSEKDIEIPITK